MQFLYQQVRKSFQATLGKFEVSRTKPFLRAVNASTPLLAQQRVLHVDRNDQFVKQPALLRRSNLGQGVKFRPAIDFFRVRIEKLPAESARHPKAAVIRSAAANPDQAPFCAGLRDLLQKQPKTFGVQLEGMIFSTRKLRQPNQI